MDMGRELDVPIGIRTEFSPNEIISSKSSLVMNELISDLFDQWMSMEYDKDGEVKTHLQ